MSILEEAWTPPFCPLHNCLSPCFACLYPEIIDIVAAYNDGFNGTVIMLEIDRNDN